MSARLVKQQLVDLQAWQSSSKAPSTAAGVAKRKRRKAAKKAAGKVPTFDVEATRQRNLRYYKAVLASEKAAATAALMTEVQHIFVAFHSTVHAGLAYTLLQQLLTDCLSVTACRSSAKPAVQKPGADRRRLGCTAVRQGRKQLRGAGHSVGRQQARVRRHALQAGGPLGAAGCTPCNGPVGSTRRQRSCAGKPAAAGWHPPRTGQPPQGRVAGETPPGLPA